MTAYIKVVWYKNANPKRNIAKKNGIGNIKLENENLTPVVESAKQITYKTKRTQTMFFAKNFLSFLSIEFLSFDAKYRRTRNKTIITSHKVL